ncbi:MAG: hypothetical protein BM485_16750 [Desulfobulbaceae bacterium DB1]|nr:MAG: hypothetical protein BM485_16750 [Desulfobulbaceae bacterium DB1]
MKRILSSVMPAQAGIQNQNHWVPFPAFAGRDPLCAGTTGWTSLRVFAPSREASCCRKLPYVSADEAKPILKAGLTAEDPQVRENAERARENLLRLGRFDYLDVE